MNFVIDLADRRVCCSVVEHWSMESKQQQQQQQQPLFMCQI